MLVISARRERTQLADEPQDPQRIGTTRHEIADEDDAVAGSWPEGIEKVDQLTETPVHVADPNRASHGPTVPGDKRPRHLAGAPGSVLPSSPVEFARSPMMKNVRQSAFFFASLLTTLSLAGCGEKEEPYQKVPPVQGVSASLPPVPNVPEKPEKDGDAYTVWGASFALRNRVHTKEVSDQELTLTGYIVKTNLPDAPECAVHEGGKADPEGCRPPVPTFWVADDKGADLKDAIKVMGWASNYAQVYDAIKEFDTGKEDAAYADAVWGVNLPKPLPGPGAKVKVKGTYSSSFSMASGGIEADPVMGIMTYKEMTYLEEPAELATLPGVKRKPKR